MARALIPLLLLFLAGCGQSGDLYLPEDPPAEDRQDDDAERDADD